MATPFKSIAQMERCKRLVAEGKIPQSSFDESMKVTDLASLPERLHPKKEETDKSAAKVQAENRDQG